METPPSRRDYILQQKKNHNRPAVAVLPIHYPKEILTALDILSVEMWGPPGSPTGKGAAILQTYICPVVRNAMSFIEAGKADVVDGILFPHTCDSLQGLASLVPDWGYWKKPVFRFQHPRGAERPEARAYLLDEMKSLISGLEKSFDRKMSGEKLSSSIRLHEDIDDLQRTLFVKRPFFAGSDLDLYGLLRQGEYLWPFEYLSLLKKAVGGLSPKPVRDGIPVMVTGYVPEPMGVLGALDDAGAFIVADDYAAVGRRIPVNGHTEDAGGDPIQRMIRRYLSYPPCPTRSYDAGMRLSYLLDLARHSGARGVVIHEVKFCEPELFDVPLLRETFEKAGLPVLFLETEMERTLSAQITTRIEAFMEILRGLS